MRRPVQITATRDEDGDGMLLALADDGTLWQRLCLKNSEWRQLPDLPQHDSDCQHKWNEDEDGIEVCALCGEERGENR